MSFSTSAADVTVSRTARSPRSDRASSSTASEGLIVTNNHVIEGADEIVINFHDGSKLKVDKVLGKDSKADIAC